MCGKKLFLMDLVLSIIVGVAVHTLFVIAERNVFVRIGVPTVVGILSFFILTAVQSGRNHG